MNCILLFNNNYVFLSLLVFLVIIIDILTGIIKSKISRNLNSNSGWLGFWKKISLIAGLFFGYFLDLFECYLISLNGGENYSFNLPIGEIVAIYIILNECISVVENLYECNVKLPKLIVNILKITNDRINDL